MNMKKIELFSQKLIISLCLIFTSITGVCDDAHKVDIEGSYHFDDKKKDIVVTVVSKKESDFFITALTRELLMFQDGLYRPIIQKSGVEIEDYWRFHAWANKRTFRISLGAEYEEIKKRVASKKGVFMLFYTYYAVISKGEDKLLGEVQASHMKLKLEL